MISSWLESCVVNLPRRSRIRSRFMWDSAWLKYLASSSPILFPTILTHMSRRVKMAWWFSLEPASFKTWIALVLTSPSLKHFNPSVPNSFTKSILWALYQCHQLKKSSNWNSRMKSVTSIYSMLDLMLSFPYLQFYYLYVEISRHSKSSLIISSTRNIKSMELCKFCQYVR